MPIKIPNDLPAFQKLQQEGVGLIGEDDALRQDIRPMQVALLNLMPEKPKTEMQLARLLGATPLQVELTLLTTSTYRPNTVPLSHLQSFYKTWDEVQDRKFDGLIITGAPIEHLEFEAVSYWNELRELFAWTQTNVHSTMGVCWGGMAMLHHFHGTPKHMLPGKAFGCFRHIAVEPSAPLLQGFSDSFLVPVSRWTEVRGEDLDLAPDLRILIDSEDVGPCLVEDRGHRAYYMFNHLEYDSTTLGEEYERDVASGGPIAAPVGYFPDDDPRQAPENLWRSHGALLYGNWINEIYQTAPFRVEAIGA